MKAGLFLVKNNITEKTFIVSVNGTEPFLRISNIINTTDFVNGKLNVDEEEKKSILEVPNNYSFNELSKEIEQVKEIPIEERLPKITENAYNKLKTFQTEEGFLDKIEVISQLTVMYSVSWEIAEKMFEIIEKRYIDELKNEYEQTSYT